MPGSRRRPHKGAKLEDTLSFFHQLATLVSSGTPLLQALKIAVAQCESTKLRTVLDEITAKVSAGSTFHAAAAAFPQVFEFQWLEAIRTGEVTGKMAQVLIELNKQIRESRETKRKVKGALMYPMILTLVAVIAVTVMLWLVVPVFAKMFKDMDAELPGVTQFVVDASDAIVKYGHYGLITIVLVVVAFKRYMKTDSGRRYVIGTLMVVPSVGQLIIEMAMYRFASNLSLMLKSGVPMMETMHTIKGIFHDQPDLSRCSRAGRAEGRRRPLAALGTRRIGLVPAHAHQHGAGGRGIGPARPGHGAGRPVLQGEDGRHDPESHKNG